MNSPLCKLKNLKIHGLNFPRKHTEVKKEEQESESEKMEESEISESCEESESSKSMDDELKVL